MDPPVGVDGRQGPRRERRASSRPIRPLPLPTTGVGGWAAVTASERPSFARVLRGTASRPPARAVEWAIVEEPEFLARQPLTGRTLRGTAVQVATTFGLSAFGLLRGVLFARWFVPAELGVYESAALMVRLAGLFSQLGTRQAVIREGTRFRRLLASALVFDGLVSSFSYLVLLIGAPWVARWLHNPELTFWIRLLAITIYSSTLALPAAQWDRAMRFGISKLPRALGTLATIGATAVLRHGGFGTESLLWGALVGFAIEHAMIWLLVPYRPRPGWEAQDVQRLAAFTLPLVLNAVLNYVVFEGDDLLVRAFHNDATLALYQRAFEWPYYLTNVVAMTSAVLYPALCRVAGEPSRVRRAFGQSNRYIGLVTLPAGVGLAAFAAPLVRLLYGEAWLTCVPWMMVFALAFALRTATGYNWHLLPMSRGDTRSVARVGAGSAVLTVALGLPLISRYGGLGGAVTNALVLVLWALPARFWVVRTELGSLDFLRDLGPPLVAAAGASAVAFLPEARDWPTLGGQLSLFVLTYVLLLLAFRPGLVAEARTMIESMRQP